MIESLTDTVAADQTSQAMVGDIRRLGRFMIQRPLHSLEIPERGTE